MWTSKCQVFFYNTQKAQKLDQIGALKGLSDFLTCIVAKHQKIEGGTPFGEIFFREKSLTMPKQTETVPFGIF